MSDGPADGDSLGPDPAEAQGDGLIYGLFLVAVAVWFLWSARDIPAAGTNPRDPGPRAFPLMLAAALGAAGAGLVARQLAQGFARTKRVKSPPAQQPSLLRPLAPATAAPLMKCP